MTGVPQRKTYTVRREENRFGVCFFAQSNQSGAILAVSESEAGCEADIRESVQINSWSVPDLSDYVRKDEP